MGTDFEPGPAEFSDWREMARAAMQVAPAVAARQAKRDELLALGLRAVRKGDCTTVLIAPDHTGEDNYHHCHDAAGHGRLHLCGCGYTWKAGGVVVNNPFKAAGSSVEGPA